MSRALGVPSQTVLAVFCVVAIRTFVNFTFFRTCRSDCVAYSISGCDIAPKTGKLRQAAKKTVLLLLEHELPRPAGLPEVGFLPFRRPPEVQTSDPFIYLSRNHL